MIKEEKEKIDNMSFYEMFERWRFAPAGDRLFAGDTGEYFSKVFKEKRNEVSAEEYVGISKKLGW